MKYNTVGATIGRLSVMIINHPHTLQYNTPS